MHESVYDQLWSRPKPAWRVFKLVTGTILKCRGPVVSRKQKERVLGYLEKARQQGAEVVVPGGEAEVSGRLGGFYVKPAVLAGAADNVAAREEIFGPVPYLLKLKEEEEAIELVNRVDLWIGQQRVEPESGPSQSSGRVLGGR